MHPVHKLPDGGPVINSDPPLSGQTIPVPGAEPVADGSHSEPDSLRAADLPEGKTAPPEGDTSEAENIVEKIRAQQQRLDGEEGEVVRWLIGIGFYLNALKAVSGRSWGRRLKTLGYTPRVAGRLQMLATAWAGVTLSYSGEFMREVCPRLPVDLIKLEWLCRLDAEQLRDLLHRIDCKRTSRTRIAEEVRTVLGEEPPAKPDAVTAAVGTIDRMFARLGKTLGGLKGEACDAGQATQVREALSAGFSRMLAALELANDEGAVS